MPRPGIFRVQSVEPPPFNTIISAFTLATLPQPAQNTVAKRYKKGDKVLMSATNVISNTLGDDWKHIGNVADTFFVLFYEDDPATGKTPTFIEEAFYYAKWPITGTGKGWWASADWMSEVIHAQSGDHVPGGSARGGSLANIIADIYSPRLWSGWIIRIRTGTSTKPSQREKRHEAFGSIRNFEVKHHGPMPVDRWIPVERNIAPFRQKLVDPLTGTWHDA